MNNPAHRARIAETTLTLPALVWLGIFFLLPTLNVLFITFRPATLNGGIGEGWTLETLLSLRNPNYPLIVWRTLWVSASIALFCLLLAVPVAYFMSRVPDRWKTRILLMVMVPFLTNFIIRVFAWKVILHPEGVIGRLFSALGLIEPGQQLLYNTGAVILVSVYTYLPFAILPVYAVAEKFDFALLEAAMDLGCKRFAAFWKIFIPGIQRGLVSAWLLVFIPNLGSYVIPHIIGGHGSELLGNVIARRLFTDRNLPHAAGLASLLTLGVVLPMVGGIFLHRRREKAGAAAS
jgi:spermidine/putrescine transport system permease protein